MKLTMTRMIEIIDMEDSIPTKIKMEEMIYTSKPIEITPKSFSKKCNDLNEKFRYIDREVKLHGKPYPSYFSSMMKWITETEKTVFEANDVIKQFNKINGTQLNTLISYMIKEKIVYQINNFSFHICKDFKERYKKIFGSDKK